MAPQKCVAVGLLFGIFLATIRAAPPPDVPLAVVKLTNEERVRRKRPPLTANPRLMRAAQLHADQMARSGRLDHELRRVPYPRPEDRLHAVGYDWQAWSENIATGQDTPAAVVASWIKSRGHHRNIVDPSMTETGVGFAKDRAGRLWWVQVFARPMPR